MVGVVYYQIFIYAKMIVEQTQRKKLQLLH